MNFKIFDKVCVLIVGFKGGVLECLPKASEVLCLGGAKAQSPLDRGYGFEGDPQEGGQGGKDAKLTSFFKSIFFNSDMCGFYCFAIIEADSHS